MVNNAIKFTPDGGQVVINALIDPEIPNSMRFTVVDTGIGIPPHKQQEIFDAFKQADMTDTREYGGTGLGLTICRELVDLHGGTMSLQSTEGVGSAFWFTIPLAEVDAEAIE